MSNLIIYSDEHFIVKQNPDYPMSPGFYIIQNKQMQWESSKDSIIKLADLQKYIRNGLWEMGVQLVGIYMEKSNDGRLKSLIIPYHLEVLRKLNISPDLYQPYIDLYLQSLKNDNCNADIVAFNNRILCYLNSYKMR